MKKPIPFENFQAARTLNAGQALLKKLHDGPAISGFGPAMDVALVWYVLTEALKKRKADPQKMQKPFMDGSIYTNPSSTLRIQTHPEN